MNLFKTLGEPYPDIELTGLAEHTSEVKPGYGFISVSREHKTAERYAQDAVRQGARLVLSAIELDLADVPCAVVPDIARQRGALATALYGDPSAKLDCVGVTGTNGKTSVAFYVASLSEALGASCGYLGTLGWGRPDTLEGGEMTTANAVALQRRLAALAGDGCVRAALEVSSHALDQDRAAAVRFGIGVFTNLTRDHLDYHGSMAAYGAAKLKLFSEFELGAAVVYAKDPFAASVAAATEAPVHTYGAADTGAAWRWRRMAAHSTGARVRWTTPAGEIEADVPLVADFAVDNLTAAIVVLWALGHALSEIEACLSQLSGVPGRMEVVSYDPTHPLVVVDYAHTPDALDKALAALRLQCRGSLACVVGCGGDRDKGKRPQMAQVARRGADRVVLTSDNPRSEPPQAIIDDMLDGLGDEMDEIITHVDRRAAIREALASADTLDTILIAGKGHEDYQEVEGVRLPFDDRLVARELLGGRA